MHDHPTALGSAADNRSKTLQSMHRVLLACVACCLLHTGGLVAGQTGSDAKALRTYLFSTLAYDKKIRPVTDQTQYVNVSINLALIALNDVNEVAEVLKVTGYLTVLWKDEFLVWTPGSHGNIAYSVYPQADIWKPDVALKNSFGQYKDLGVPSLPVHVNNDGVITWTPFEVFSSTCSVDMTYFPFDVQKCLMKFIAWSYTKADVYLWSRQTRVDLTEYESNPGWDVIGTSVSHFEDDDETEVHFTIDLRRKSMYYAIYLVLPIIMLSVLDICVFLLPCDSGEKASYAITVFLAFAVFLTIVSASLPKNSQGTSIFSVYVILQTVQSTLVTIAVLGLIRLNKLSASSAPVPAWLARITSPRTINTEHVNGNLRVTPIEDEKQSEHQATGRETKVLSGTNWELVTNRLDLYFFLFFSLITILSTLICLAICSHPPMKM